MGGLYEAHRRAKRKAELEQKLHDAALPSLIGGLPILDQALVDAIREVALPAIEERKRAKEEASERARNTPLLGKIELPKVNLIEPLPLAALTIKKSRAGAKPTRNKEFDELAGRLWNERERGKNVDHAALVTMGRKLDAAQLGKPAERLEGRYKQELNTYNRNWGHSAKKIRTWEALAQSKHEKLKIGMRRLLSRCGRNRELNRGKKSNPSNFLRPFQP